MMPSIVSLTCTVLPPRLKCGNATSKSHCDAGRSHFVLRLCELVSNFHLYHAALKSYVNFRPMIGNARDWYEELGGSPASTFARSLSLQSMKSKRSRPHVREAMQWLGHSHEPPASSLPNRHVWRTRKLFCLLAYRTPRER